MAARLLNVEIENFRSIHRASVPLNYLSVLVGTNDSGKSNILRALNLFFNGETGKGRPFNFQLDHNLYNNPNRRAREVIVRVTIEMPDAYIHTNGDVIVWEKRWRETGLFSDTYKGFRVTTNRAGRTIHEEVKISSRSNVHSLLRKVEFVYVPAIRDATYFDSLRGQIHSVIAEVADETFRGSSRDFENSIALHLDGLTQDILNELGINSRLALPRDLTHVFERLDFLTGASEISLDSRGDGIKARHIPLILKFMADQKRRLQTRGAAPISIVWAYEEPENNLEFTNAVGLADELWKFMFDDVAQVVVTSHSPVFYNLAAKNEGDNDFVSCLHVSKDDERAGTEISQDLTDLDERMGTTAILAPRIAAVENEIRMHQRALVQAEQLAAAGRPKIFLEGTSDLTFLTRLFEVLSPGFLGQVADLETLESGAGHAYVGDMLSSWYCVQKHRGGRPRAVGIVDADEPGLKLKKAWNQVAAQASISKCFAWPTPPRLHPVKAAGFAVPITLEELYPPVIWERAALSDLLQDRDLSTIVGQERLNAVIRNGTDVLSEIPDGSEIYVLRSFTQAGKSPAARRVSEMTEEDIRSEFGFMQTMVDEIRRYLES